MARPAESSPLPQLEIEGVDISAEVGIREIVSGRFQVFLSRMARRHVDRNMVQAIGVRLEAQRQQELAQSSAPAGEQADGDVLAPRLAQDRDRAATRADTDQTDRGQALQLIGIEVVSAIHVRNDPAVEVDARARDDPWEEPLGLPRLRHTCRLTALDPQSAPPPG